MPPAWFEPAIPPIKRPQIYDLDRANTGIDTAATNLNCLLSQKSDDFANPINQPG
jgi:hypothetical protein